MTQPIVGKPINQLAQWDEQKAFKNSRPRIYGLKFGQMCKSYKWISSISLSIYIHLIYHISLILTCFSWDFLASVRRVIAGDGRSRRRKCFAPAFRRICCTLPGGPWRGATNMAKSMELEGEDIEWHRNMVEHMVKMMVMEGYGRINFRLNTLAILIAQHGDVDEHRFAGVWRCLASQVLLILTVCTWDEGVALHELAVIMDGVL